MVRAARSFGGAAGTMVRSPGSLRCLWTTFRRTCTRTLALGASFPWAAFRSLVIGALSLICQRRSLWQANNKKYPQKPQSPPQKPGPADPSFLKQNSFSTPHTLSYGNRHAIIAHPSYPQQKPLLSLIPPTNTKLKPPSPPKNPIHKTAPKPIFPLLPTKKPKKTYTLHSESQGLSHPLKNPPPTLTH